MPPLAVAPPLAPLVFELPPAFAPPVVVALAPPDPVVAVLEVLAPLEQAALEQSAASVTP